MEERNCGSCRFWIPRIRKSILGECHGGPPTARPGQNRKAVWPKTESTDWCGQFEAKQDTNDSQAEHHKNGG